MRTLIVALGSTSGANKIVRGSMDFRYFAERLCGSPVTRAEHEHLNSFLDLLPH